MTIWLRDFLASLSKASLRSNLEQTIIKMGLFSSSSSSPKEVDTKASPVVDKVKGQISQELAVTNATELVGKISDNCFEKCIQQPQDRVSAQENHCLGLCMEKYMRSWNVISRAYISRIQQSSN